MMTDPIADMLARIRNGQLARRDRLELPHSGIKERIASVLKQEGYLDDVRVGPHSNGTGKGLTIVLRYGKDRQAAIDGLRRVSSPGRRVYVGSDRIGKVRSGLGIAVLSTSAGVMTDREARSKGIGGEVLCEVW